MSMTITEALSEVNLIKKKMTLKQDVIKSCLTKMMHLKDAYESVGGSKKMIQNETQALNDLQSRLEKIRAAISTANIENKITLNEQTKSIVEWLTWKREVSADYLKFINAVVTAARTEILGNLSRPQVYKDDANNNQLIEFESNIDLAEWSKKAEQVTSLIEQLDGKLSLKNATIVIHV